MRRGLGRLGLTVLGAAALSLVMSSSANAAVLNCLSGCPITSFAGAVWVTTDMQSTGTGVIDSFVRISAANQEIVDGHNTSGRPLLNDENSSPQFTRDLQLSEVPVVNIAGTNYYEFLLDINQTGSDPGLSLDKVQICLDAAGGLRAVDTCPSGPPEYNLDAIGDNEVVLDYSLNSGSGSGDLFMYIPVTTLGTNTSLFVYLYSQFGANSTGFTSASYPGGFGNNDGFEEWAVLTPGVPPPIPEPASLLLFGTGLAAVARTFRKRVR